MFLIDANVWIESHFSLTRGEEANEFLHGVRASCQHVADITLHSVGILFRRHRRLDKWSNWLSDLQLEPPNPIVMLTLHQMAQIPAVAQRWQLDFEDAYLHVAANEFTLDIVSFDTDFDRTERGRLTPGQALAAYRARTP